MEVKLTKINDGSKEAELLSLICRYYDYYSKPVKDDIFWDSLIRHGRTIHDMHKGTELETVASSLVVGVCNAIEEKYKRKEKR